MVLKNTFQGQRFGEEIGYKNCDSRYKVLFFFFKKNLPNQRKIYF